MLLYLVLLWRATSLVVEEFAGQVTPTAASSGFDGPALNATFNEPVGIAIDSVKHIAYVADHDIIRMLNLPKPDFHDVTYDSLDIEPLLSGDVRDDLQTCASACRDAYQSTFNWHRPLCLAHSDGCSIASSDDDSGTLSNSGLEMSFVKTLPTGSPPVTFTNILAVTWDADRNVLYIADELTSGTSGSLIRVLNATTNTVETMTVAGLGPGLKIKDLFYHSDFIFCTLVNEHAILAITVGESQGQLTHLTGSRDFPGTHTPLATRVGAPNRALFYDPDGLVVDSAANRLLVADKTNNKIRAVDLGVPWDTNPLCSVVYLTFPEMQCGPVPDTCTNQCKSTQADIETACSEDSTCMGWQKFDKAAGVTRYVKILHFPNNMFDPWMATVTVDANSCFMNPSAPVSVGWKTCALPVTLGCSKNCGECAGPCTIDSDCGGALRCFHRTADANFALLRTASCLPGDLLSHSNPGEVNICYNPRGTVTEVPHTLLTNPSKLSLDPVTRTLFSKNGRYVASRNLTDATRAPVLAEFTTEPRGLAVNTITGVLYGTAWDEEGEVVAGEPPPPPGFMGVTAVRQECGPNSHVNCGAGRWCDGTCVACSMQGGENYDCSSNQWRSGVFCDGTGFKDQLCTRCTHEAPYSCPDGTYRNGQECNGQRSTDQTCADCENQSIFGVYGCRSGSYKNGKQCQGDAYTDTQTCGLCGNSIVDQYRCSVGYYRSGVTCDGSGESDTQTCDGCFGSTFYSCGTNYHRSGSTCDGSSDTDTQLCAVTNVVIMQANAQLPIDVPFTVTPHETLEVRITVGQDHSERKVLAFGPIHCIAVDGIDQAFSDFPALAVFYCDVPSGVGRDLPLSIFLDDSRQSLLWTSPNWTASFPRPSLTHGSLRLAKLPTIAAPWGPPRELLVDPPGEVSVQFEVAGFFTTELDVEVLFIAPTTRRCEVYDVSSTNVKCTLEYLSGYIQPLAFTVAVGPRGYAYLLSSNDTLRYPATPDLIASAGCATTPTLANPWTVGCNTAGGDIITLIGQRLWLGAEDSVAIVIESSETYPSTEQVLAVDVVHSFPGFNLTGLEAVTFQLQAGQGLQMAMTAGDGKYVSGTGPYLSYNIPNITDVLCDCPGQGGVVDCRREGGNKLTLRGSDFGAGEPTVHVGCNKCAIDLFSHKEIQCTLSFGKEKDLVPQVTQAGLGGYSFASSTISYLPCSAGTYVLAHDCVPCDPGTFSATSEAIMCQTCPHGRFSDYGASECQQCPVGTRVLENATGCASCGPGYHSAAASRTCSLCPLGRASNATEAENCPRCDLGTYQGQTGKTSCLDCPAGKYTSSAEGTVCQNCLSGYIASTAGSDHCEPCAPGKKARLGQTCESCEAGTFSGNAAPECEPCIPGTVSDEAASSCAACPTGTNSSDSASFCIPCAPGRFARVPGSTECVPCSAGSYSTGQAANCATCLPGHFSRGGASECTSCPPGTSSAIDGAAACSECGRSFFAASNGSEYCTACASQSSADENRTTCLCDAGAYLSHGANTCVPCHVGGNCKTAGVSLQTLSPKAGWSASMNKDDENVFIACPRPSSCLAGGGCSLGYEGPLCASCQHGFGKRGKFECGTCTSQVLRVLSLVGLALAALILGVFMVWKTRRGALESRGHFSVVLKVLFSAAQFNGMAAVIEFNWVAQLGVLVGMVNVSHDVATLGSSFISMECLLAEQRKGLGPFQAKSLLFLFAPLLIPLIAAPLVVSIVLLQRQCGQFSAGDIAEDAAIEKEEQAERQQQQHEEEEEDSSSATTDLAHANPLTKEDGELEEEPEAELHMWKIAKDFFATACVVLLFVVHPSLTRTALQMFNCRLVTAPGPNQRAYLIDDMNMECWTADHYLWAFLVSTPMFIIYAIGIPAAYTLILCRNRTKFKQLRTARKYSFLYKGYTPNVYYWEAIIFTRKVLVGCIVVFWSDSPQMQGLMAIFLATTAAFAHIYVMPYESNIYNLLEFVALLMSCLTFLCGQMTFADPDNLWTHFFSVLAIAASIVLLLLSAYLLSGWILGKICTKLRKGSSGPDEHVVDGLGKGLAMEDGAVGVEMASMETGGS